MHDTDRIFSIEDDYILVKDIHALVKLCRYRQQRNQLLIEGLERADDLLSSSGVTLYAAALYAVDSIVGKSAGKQLKLYYEAWRASAGLFKDIKLGSDASAAIKYVHACNFGETGFIKQDNNKTAWIANIIHRRRKIFDS